MGKRRKLVSFEYERRRAHAMIILINSRLEKIFFWYFARKGEVFEKAD